MNIIGIFQNNLLKCPLISKIYIYSILSWSSSLSLSNSICNFSLSSSTSFWWSNKSNCVLWYSSFSALAKAKIFSISVISCEFKSVSALIFSSSHSSPAISSLSSSEVINIKYFKTQKLPICCFNISSCSKSFKFSWLLSNNTDSKLKNSDLLKIIFHLFSP